MRTLFTIFFFFSFNEFSKFLIGSCMVQSPVRPFSEKVENLEGIDQGQGQFFEL